MKVSEYKKSRLPFLYRGDDCFLNYIPEGWRPAVVGAAEEIVGALKEAGLDVSYIWTADMIEREGHLRWYWGMTEKGLPDEVADKIKEIVGKVEDATLGLCVHCGAPATKTLKVMYYPLCADCAKQNKYYNLTRELKSSLPF